MKKVIALFLVFSLLTLSGNLYAEKKGTDLVIIKKDGQPARGELIVVKKNSLVLLSYDSNADVSVDVENIKFIKIVKKSKVLLGASLGLLLGGGLGSLYGTSTDTYNSDLKPLAFIVYGGGGAVLGVLVGGFLGASAGKEKTIQIEGKSDSEIKEILEELRKKARVPNFQ
ncbi:MAG: hypothetical protein WBE11_09905 [Candidatus Aminicenantaceae bacterium]